ncbi:hypothetical protein TorRG33x02_241000 [Trema orientale]|uniref:Uncharacterized protein n=1 Tax=Trema orientale TaxID=63057 RepID=A0A2P5DV13_TREOI|nr:hypothetical protein TorRG33x02_241000 [Trema orientale]
MKCGPYHVACKATRYKYIFPLGATLKENICDIICHSVRDLRLSDPSFILFSLFLSLERCRLAPSAASPLSLSLLASLFTFAHTLRHSHLSLSLSEFESEFALLNLSSMR